MFDRIKELLFIFLAILLFTLKKHSIVHSLNGRGVWGRMDTCICMAESPPYSPETVTTLLTNYVVAVA